jgi:hypothetical protein
LSCRRGSPVTGLMLTPGVVFDGAIAPSAGTRDGSGADAAGPAICWTSVRLPTPGDTETSPSRGCPSTASSPDLAMHPVSVTEVRNRLNRLDAFRDALIVVTNQIVSVGSAVCSKLRSWRGHPWLVASYRFLCTPPAATASSATILSHPAMVLRSRFASLSIASYSSSLMRIVILLPERSDSFVTSESWVGRSGSIKVSARYLDRLPWATMAAIDACGQPMLP